MDMGNVACIGGMRILVGKHEGKETTWKTWAKVQG
jgi:hypothetical protein